ncbi:uncharacterized protein LOC100371551 [Saccoglossus kowalevskii]|uniref:Uncharacterized protein LOC100371551 n=1 Tax=Saccoglossus kowalevskii TaxID=10224 RepID=A0ABM0GJI3_SACKO|nr:PREDICTED: uncharacterized protein LOC100371551 [Saccoglossus kowalevskii]
MRLSPTIAAALLLILASSLSSVTSYINIRDLEEELTSLMDADDDNSKEETGNHGNAMDKHGGVPMGIPSFRHGKCDDGHTDLWQDWNGSKDDYTCMQTNHWKSQRNDNIQWDKTPELKKYEPPTHVCMQQKIYYSDKIPTVGPHRPLWPKYGEYLYLPPQRYLHTLEHGAIVAMFHPCTDKNEVDILRDVVIGCLGRYIITPNKHLTKDRPIALIAWRQILRLPYADKDVIQTFIKEHAFRGPEQNAYDGQFDDNLIVHSKINLKEIQATLCT